MTIKTSNTELLLMHLAGKLSSSEEHDLKKKLKEDIQLRYDLYFLMAVHLADFPEKVCPSDDLLADYFKIVHLSSIMKANLKEHIRTCRGCSRSIEEMEGFSVSVQQKKTEILESFSLTTSPLLNWLKRFAKATDYIDHFLIEPLFERLEALSSQKRSEFALANVRGDSRKQRKFRELLQKLLPEEQEFNALLDKGDKDKIKEKLQTMLQDEELIEELMRYLP